MCSSPGEKMLALTVICPAGSDHSLHLHLCCLNTLSYTTLPHTPHSSLLPAASLTWQSMASNSLNLSLKAMISVGHTNVNAACGNSTAQRTPKAEDE